MSFLRFSQNQIQIITTQKRFASVYGRIRCLINQSAAPFSLIRHLVVKTFTLNDHIHTIFNYRTIQQLNHNYLIFKDI